MKNLIHIILILLCLFLIASTTVKEERPRNEPQEEETTEEAEEEEETDITGYGDILFGSAVHDLDITHFESPAGIEFTKCWIVNDESYQTFTIADKTFDAFAFIGSLDNSTVATVIICLEFPLTMDLDEISSYARSVRSMYINKYPQQPSWDIWVWDYDSDYMDWWVGDLEIHDQDGDVIWIHWDGYSLRISYRNTEYQQAVWDNAVEQFTDQADRI